MSLGDHTKCDLSMNIAKIDRDILIKSLTNSFYSLKNEINHLIGDSCITPINDILISYVSHRNRDLISKVNQLAIITELLETIIESKTRETVNFVDTL